MTAVAELRNFNRIHNLFLKKQKDPNFLAMASFSSGFADFMGLGGAELLVKRGFEAYKKTAKGYWKLLTGKK